MNLCNTHCLKCNKEIIASIDEISLFDGSVCTECDTALCKHIRHKAVYGFYDIDSVVEQIADKIIEKENQMIEIILPVSRKTIKVLPCYFGQVLTFLHDIYPQTIISFRRIT